MWARAEEHDILTALWYNRSSDLKAWLTVLGVPREGIDTRMAAVNAIYAHLTKESTEGSASGSSEDGDSGSSSSAAGNTGLEAVEEATEEATEEVIAGAASDAVEQEYNEVQMETAIGSGDEQEVASKDKDSSKGKSKGKDWSIRSREEFFRIAQHLRRESAAIGSRDGKDGGSDGKDGKDGGSGGSGGADDQKEEEYAVEEGGSMQIFVLLPQGNSITLDVEASDTISLVKALVKQKEGIPRAEQRLLHSDNDLEDDKSLSDYNIQNDDTLVLAMRLDGAGKRARAAMAGGTKMDRAAKLDALKESIGLATVRVNASMVVTNPVQNTLAMVTRSLAATDAAPKRAIEFALAAASPEELQTMNGIAASTNLGAKTANLMKIFYARELAILAEVEKQVTMCKNTLSELTEYQVLTQFGDDNGISWVGFSNRLMGVVADRGVAIGAAAAAAAAAAQ
jgi:hypothetical protein